MKMLRNYLLFCAAAILLAHSGLIGATLADNEWARLHAPGWDSEDEGHRLVFREQGVEFFRQFPAEQRRLVWLLQTLMYPPRYFKSGQAREAFTSGSRTSDLFDAAKQGLWDEQYVGLRAAILNGLPAGHDAVLLCHHELVEKAHRVAEKRPVDVAGLINLVWVYATVFEQESEYTVLVAKETVEALEATAQYSSRDILIDALTHCSNVAVREYGQARKRLLSFQHTPLSLQFRTQDNRLIDLRDFRGKLVLLDFWSVWCSGCVADLPKIKALYEKYRARGFEIIGICPMRHEMSERSKIEDLLVTQDIRWPQWIVGGSESLEVTNRFGIVGYPFMLLLSEDGRLIAMNMTLHELEAELQRRLGN